MEVKPDVSQWAAHNLGYRDDGRSIGGILELPEKLAQLAADAAPDPDHLVDIINAVEEATGWLMVWDDTDGNYHFMRDRVVEDAPPPGLFTIAEAVHRMRFETDHSIDFVDGRVAAVRGPRGASDTAETYLLQSALCQLARIVRTTPWRLKKLDDETWCFAHPGGAVVNE